MTTTPISFVPTIANDGQRRIATVLQGAGQKLIGILQDGLDRNQFRHFDGLLEDTYFSVRYVSTGDRKQQLTDLIGSLRGMKIRAAWLRQVRDVVVAAAEELNPQNPDGSPPLRVYSLSLQRGTNPVVNYYSEPWRNFLGLHVWAIVPAQAMVEAALVTTPDQLFETFDLVGWWIGWGIGVSAALQVFLDPGSIVTLEPSTGFLRPHFEHREDQLRLVDVFLSQDLMSQRRAHQAAVLRETRRREEPVVVD